MGIFSIFLPIFHEMEDDFALFADSEQIGNGERGIHPLA